MKNRRAALGVAALCLAIAAVPATAAQAKVIKIGEYKLSNAKMKQLRTNWVNQIYSKYSYGTWAPMRMELSDADLKIMGLPPRRVLTKHRYRTPTAVYPNGKMVRLGARSRGKKPPPGGGGGSTAADPAVASF